MRKVLTYTSFSVLSLIVVLVFVTAKSYTQLGAAVLLYPVAAYFAYKLFVNKANKHSEITLELPIGAKTDLEQEEDMQENSIVGENLERVSVIDIEKRAFLKLVGATGLSFFLFSLINRRTGSLFSRSGSSGETTLLDPSGNKITPAERQVTDGYKISEIDDLNIVSYYGFINKEGGWLIMKEDSDTGSFRYIKGDSEFPTYWSRREKLNYDYFHNTF